MAKLSQHTTGRKAGIWYIDCTINGRRAKKALGRDEIVARQRYAQLVATLELEAEARRQSSTQEDPALQRLADWYVEELMAARGNRESSRDLNHRKLKRWVVWCNARRIETYGDLCNQVTAIDAYAAHLLETLAPSTTRQHLATIKAVLDQAERRKLVQHRFALTDWPRPRVAPTTYDVTLTVDQFHAILAAVGTYYPHYLDAVTFLAYVGCRPSDVAALRWSSVHFLTQTAEILQVKTAQPVTIQLAPQAVAALRRAWKSREPGQTHVFTCQTGGPLTTNALSCMLYRVAKKLGHPCNARLFRQYIATDLLEHGADRETIRLITGHRSHALEAYLKRRSARARVAVEAFAERHKWGCQEDLAPDGTTLQKSR